jgi:hypothetical protein
MKPIRTSALKQRRVLAVVEIGAGDIDFKGVAIKCLKPSCLKYSFAEECLLTGTASNRFVASNAV